MLGGGIFRSLFLSAAETNFSALRIASEYN